jgi:hypothetical protein
MPKSRRAKRLLTDGERSGKLGADMNRSALSCPIDPSAHDRKGIPFAAHAGRLGVCRATIGRDPACRHGPRERIGKMDTRIVITESGQ